MVRASLSVWKLLGARLVRSVASLLMQVSSLAVRMCRWTKKYNLHDFNHILSFAIKAETFFLISDGGGSWPTSEADHITYT